MSQEKQYSTAYEDHTGFLHKITKKAFGVLSQTPVRGVDYDDLYQQMCVSFVICQAQYKPEKGFAFTTYFGRACWLNFLKWMDKQIEETKAIGTIVSVEDMAAGLEDDSDVWDSLADDAARSPEDILMQHQTNRRAFRDMTPAARRLIQRWLGPDEFTLAMVEQHNAKVDATGEGKRIEVQGDLTHLSLNEMAELLGFGRSKIAELRREIGNAFNVEMFRNK